MKQETQEKTKAIVKISKKLDTTVHRIIKNMSYDEMEIAADMLRELSYIIRDGIKKKRWEEK